MIFHAGLEWDGFSWLNYKNGWGNLPVNDPKVSGFHTMATSWCGWDTQVDPSCVDTKVTIPMKSNKPMVVGLYHIMFLLPSISGSSEFILDYLWWSSWIHLKLDIHLTINTIHLVSFPAQMAIVTVRRPLGIPTFWALQTAGIAPTSIARAEQCHDDLPRHRAWT